MIFEDIYCPQMKELYARGCPNYEIYSPPNGTPEVRGRFSIRKAFVGSGIVEEGWMGEI